MIRYLLFVVVVVLSKKSIVDHASTVKSIVLRLHPGEDIMTSLVSFAQKHKLSAVTISTGVGSTVNCTIRLADDPKLTKFEGPFEIVSLTGTIAEGGLSHIHIAVSDGISGKVIGGHLPQFPREGKTDVSDPTCKVRTTLEVVLLVHEDLIFKRPIDPETTYDELVVVHKSSGVTLDH